MSAHYDVIVLGTGPSGYVAAIRAAQLGKNIQPGSADNGQPQTLSITSAPRRTTAAGAGRPQQRPARAPAVSSP
ncbi:hypothetical protein AB0H92_34590 [Streptomyces phaeochromogenes]